MKLFFIEFYLKQKKKKILHDQTISIPNLNVQWINNKTIQLIWFLNEINSNEFLNLIHYEIHLIDKEKKQIIQSDKKFLFFFFSFFHFFIFHLEKKKKI